MSRVQRRTVDLSGYPDLAVIYLGMRVNTLRGVRTLLGFGRRIQEAVRARPEGLLLHENLMFSLVAPHVGMRQYWQDFTSLERWARSLPHKDWWQRFLGDSGGTGFWHEAYSMRGGMEAVYDDVLAPVGFARFAPVHEARRPMFSARDRAGVAGRPAVAPPIREDEFYRQGDAEIDGDRPPI